jgi:hypothetical protein
MYEDQGSFKSFLVLVLFIIVFLTIGGFTVRRSAENNRARHAENFERIRRKNNSRLALIDTYVYLIKIFYYPGESFQSVFLKVGIGTEERVRTHIRKPNTELIRLYKFKVRADAFGIEQKIIRKWNTKIKGETTTMNLRSRGTESIRLSDKHLQQALLILESSSGERVDEVIDSDSELDVDSEIKSSPTIDIKSPEVLKRTQVYLIRSYVHRMVKVGMGTFSRPDKLKNSDWYIERYAYFASRPLARKAEKSVLTYWREKLKLQIPDQAKSLLESGYTETAKYIPGIIEESWQIIKSSEGYIPNITDEDLEVFRKYQVLIEHGKVLWNDEAGWAKVEAHSFFLQYTHLSLMFHYEKKGFIGLDSYQVRSLTRKMMKYMREFENYTKTHSETLEKVKKEQRWD